MKLKVEEEGRWRAWMVEEMGRSALVVHLAVRLSLQSTAMHSRNSETLQVLVIEGGY